MLTGLFLEYVMFKEPFSTLLFSFISRTVAASETFTTTVSLREALLYWTASVRLLEVVK